MFVSYCVEREEDNSLFFNSVCVLRADTVLDVWSIAVLVLSFVSVRRACVVAYLGSIFYFPHPFEIFFIPTEVFFILGLDDFVNGTVHVL